MPDGCTTECHRNQDGTYYHGPLCTNVPSGCSAGCRYVKPLVAEHVLNCPNRKPVDCHAGCHVEDGRIVHQSGCPNQMPDDCIQGQELLVAIVTSMVHFTMSVTRSMIFLLANQIVTSLVRPKCGMTLVAQIIQIIIKQQKSY